MNFSAADKVILESIRDIMFDNAPVLSVYPGSMETKTSDDATHVTVSNTIRRVMSVWLATDTGFTGTNYYSDPKAENWTGKQITLDQALPAASTSVVVAYYSDCADCGWSDTEKAGRDASCATCNGLGMTLAAGSAVSVPVKRIPRGSMADQAGAVGEETRGIVTFDIQSEYENLIKVAIQIEWEGQKLVPYEDGRGIMQIRKKYDCAGEGTAVRLITEYESIQ